MVLIVDNNKGGDSDGALTIHESLLPYRRIFSHHFHNLIEQCLSLDPQLRYVQLSVAILSNYCQSVDFQCSRSW